MFDNLKDDYRTHEGKISSQGLWVMVVYRFGRWRYRVRPALARKPLSLVYRLLKVIVQILTGIDLPCEATVGRRFRIDHFGGVIVSGDAVLGDDVVIRNGVTIGLRHREDPGSPVIGNRVDIGAGAKILGRIRVGDDVIIGANAVVIRDVPANSDRRGSCRRESCPGRRLFRFVPVVARPLCRTQPDPSRVRRSVFANALKAKVTGGERRLAREMHSRLA